MSKVKEIPEKYINKIIENSPHSVLISSNYTNQHTMIDVYCKKHNIKYQRQLCSLLAYNCCPECKKENMSKNKGYTTEQFIEKVRLKNPHIEVLGEYTKQGCRILCKCLIHNVEFYPNSASLLQGKGGCFICTKEIHSKQRISSEEIKQNFHKLNPTLKLVDDNVKLDTQARIYCTVCNQYFNKTLSYAYIKDKQAHCSVCINKVIVKGFNDVATTRPDMVKYFKNKDDAYKYGHGMTKKLIFVCPDCGYEKEMKIEVLARQGFGCPCCGDGVSYPNKFIRSFIRQLDVKNIKFEYSPNWAKGYFYDCYFEYNNNKYIIEVDGQQHFKENSNFEMTLEEVQKRDREKTKLANENNHILIRIDARKSNKDYLFYQIKNSLLSELFDLNIINWRKCDLDATTNLAKEICIYAEKIMSDRYKDICQKFDLCEDTIRKYLKQGVEYGWCSERVVEKITVPKRVSVYDNNNNLLHIFNGIRECSEKMSEIYNKKFNIHGISDNCHELRDNFKGYVFKFTYNTL